MSFGKPEINPGSKILIVGRDYGEQEEREGRPFVGASGRLLESCLSQAGLRRKDVSITNVANVRPPGNNFGKHSVDDLERGLGELETLVQDLRPVLVLCLGNEASFSLVPGWPSRTGDIFGAHGIQERRGYFWDGKFGIPVLTTLHPAAVLRAGGEESFGASGAISRLLFTYDIQRAKEVADRGELQRPERKIEVVDTVEKGREAIDVLIRSGYASCDIEIRDEYTLLCVGFAASPERAWVFTQQTFDQAFYLLGNPDVALTFHNGQFDTYFLRTRYGIDVQGYVDDTIVRFHCCWPELAGVGESKAKRTQKSLRFLASLYTKDRWWKDYSDDEAEMYELNGLDCMVTYDVEFALREVMKDLDIPKRIYRHEMSLLDPVNRILERGILVDVARLDRAVGRLAERQWDITERVTNLAKPLLEAKREEVSKPHLFWKKITCKSCRNGSKKKLICEVCGQRGQWEEFQFNPNSDVQKKILIYDLLGCPARYHNGRLTVLEDKLKDLLGVI